MIREGINNYEYKDDLSSSKLKELLMELDRHLNLSTLVYMMELKGWWFSQLKEL
jgi:hypothetical protein